MSGTSYAASYKIQQIAQSGTLIAQEQLAGIVQELSEQVQGLALIQQTIQNQLTLNFSYPVHKVHQPIANPEKETFEFWHPFGEIQFLNSSLIRVGFENDQKVPIELVYEWGWYDLFNKQGKLIVHISPAVRFFGFLEVNGFFLIQAGNNSIVQNIPNVMTESTTGNMSGDLIDGEMEPIAVSSKLNHPTTTQPEPTQSEPTDSTNPDPVVPVVEVPLENTPEVPPQLPQEESSSPEPKPSYPNSQPEPIEPQQQSSELSSEVVILYFVDSTHAEDQSTIYSNKISADVMMLEPSLQIRVEAIPNASGALLYVDLIIEGSYKVRLNYPQILAAQQKRIQVSYNSKVYPPQSLPSVSGSLIIS